jgi:dTDP-4-amino-4,6-dideoxygalactose transaminase
MTHSKIWLSSPHMGGTEQQFIKEAFDANWVAPLGPNVNGFELDIEKYLKEDRSVIFQEFYTKAQRQYLWIVKAKLGTCVL